MTTIVFDHYDNYFNFRILPYSQHYEVYKVLLLLLLGIRTTWGDEGRGPLCVSQPGASIYKGYVRFKSFK